MSSPAAHTSRHPSFKQYVAIAIFLFAITIVEFLIILPEGFRGQGWTIAPLSILSAIKFAAVIFFYMHLKFDNRLLTWIFLGGLALGFAVTFALIGLFSAFTPSPRPYAQANAVAFEHAAESEGEHVETPADAESPEPKPEPADSSPTQPAPAAASDSLAAEGQAVFTGAGICMTCHTIEGVPGAVGVIGPDLTHIATEAATRKPGMSAEEYLYESIQEPEIFIAEGVERALPGLMTDAIVSGLTDADVDALVVFLLAQE